MMIEENPVEQTEPAAFGVLICFGLFSERLQNVMGVFLFFRGIEERKITLDRRKNVCKIIFIQ
jgi:hypothetical protein